MDTQTNSRLPLLAAFLSLGGGPIGQIYAGRFLRGLLLWFVAGCLVPLLAFATVVLAASWGRWPLLLLPLCIVGIPAAYALDAFFLTRQTRYDASKWYQRWWIYLCFFFAFMAANTLVAGIVRIFLVEAFVVPTRAMTPAILDGDRMLVEKFWTRADGLRRNDVAVFRSAGPGSPVFVQRVIGLPGDTIEFRDERIFINGQPWRDEFGFFEGPLPKPFDTGTQVVDIANVGPITIPPEHFFALGDHRRTSYDSRITGPIPFSDYIGKARLIYWSREKNYPIPEDRKYFEWGRFRWERFGLRLD